MRGSPCHFLGWCTNLRSQCSELINEFGSCKIGFVIDLQFLVDLELGFDDFLMIGISKLELVSRAVVWNVVDKAYLIVVHSAFLEVKIVDSPSRLIRWHLIDESLEIGFTGSIICSSLGALKLKIASWIFTLRNSHDDPLHLAAHDTIHCFNTAFSPWKCTRIYHVFFLPWTLFYNYKTRQRANI